MKALSVFTRKAAFPVYGFIGALALWQLVTVLHLFPSYAFPSPRAVFEKLKTETASFKLVKDAIISVWRVSAGFLLSILVALPAGLLLGHSTRLKPAILPFLNFFRFLSPLAWIPFAILWFHIGDKPAIFLIFLSTFFPLTISILSAIDTIPDIYYRVARQYHFSRTETFFRVTLPAIQPQLVTALRVAFGIGWLVIIAAEMVGCQDGLGYGIWDARNALNLDTAVCYMLVIGTIGIVMDRCFLALNKKW